jgi:hypothetical protein
MCLIILSTKGEQINDDKILNAFLNNPDSWGLAWAKEGKLHMAKGFGYDSLIKAYREAAGLPHMLHFRWATSGKINTANAHPFDLGGVAFMHNGMLNVAIENRNMSDTWHYAQLLKPILVQYPEALGNPNFLKEVGESIGIGNKFTFLEADGTFAIVNEKAGKWLTPGIWVSNIHSLESPYVTPTGIRRKGRKGKGRKAEAGRNGQSQAWQEYLDVTSGDESAPCAFCGMYRTVASRRGGIEICHQCDAAERAYFRNR